jgi:hypothetical protein
MKPDFVFASDNVRFLLVPCGCSQPVVTIWYTNITDADSDVFECQKCAATWQRRDSY